MVPSLINMVSWVITEFMVLFMVLFMVPFRIIVPSATTEPVSLPAKEDVNRYRPKITWREGDVRKKGEPRDSCHASLICRRTH